jgi:hypothetical protein
MIGLLPTTAIFLATAPTDLRKAYDGLAVLVRQSLGQDPLSGSLYTCPYDCTRLGANTTPVSNHPSVSSVPRADLRGR